MTSTSTHGSGIAFGPLCEFIKSIEIVGDGGKLFRVEPSVASNQSLTDPVAWEQAHPDRARFELIQDDRWFNAVIVGMGCLGIIYAVVLEVREAFLLKETRTLATWNAAQAALLDDDYTHKSYRVFHIGEANDIPAISSEFALPVAEDSRATWPR